MHTGVPPWYEGSHLSEHCHREALVGAHEAFDRLDAAHLGIQTATSVYWRPWTTRSISCPRVCGPRINRGGGKKRGTVQAPVPLRTQERYYREIQRLWNDHLSHFEQASIEKTFLWAQGCLERTMNLVQCVLAAPVAGQPEARFHGDLCVAWFRCLSVYCAALL